MIRGQDTTPTLEDEYGWDTHNDIFPTLKDHLLPRLDRTLSALLEDLRQRGLLDETLVVCMGEFGRAPRIALEPGFAGRIPGRKHWAGVYSVLLAGAGVQGGKVVGASDSIGAFPRSTPYSPCDLAATMFAALGIDPAGHYYDMASRPYTSVRAGRSWSCMARKNGHATNWHVDHVPKSALVEDGQVELIVRRVCVRLCNAIALNLGNALRLWQLRCRLILPEKTWHIMS